MPLKNKTLLSNYEYTFYSTSIGKILILASKDYLIGLYLENQKDYPDISLCIYNQNNSILKITIEQLKEYFQKKRSSFTIPLKFITGTIFQKNIWSLLLEINYSTTLSYKDLALKYGNYKAYRAVANAVAKNPISIIIPCHRIIGSNGKLTGYASGLDKKQFLLNIETR